MNNSAIVKRLKKKFADELRYMNEILSSKTIHPMSLLDLYKTRLVCALLIERAVTYECLIMMLVSINLIRAMLVEYRSPSILAVQYLATIQTQIRIQ